MKVTFGHFLIVFVTIALCGCSGTVSNGRRWGEDVTLTPGWEKVGRSALNTLKSPKVWAPAIGALALQIDNSDERISDWALEHHPIFKDRDQANDASNDLLTASKMVYGLSVIAAPSGSLDTQWGRSKAKALGVGLAAYWLTGITTDGLKSATKRELPNSSDDDSFPSAHTSKSAVLAILADRNLQTTDMPSWAKVATKTGLTTLPLATGWARVEAAVHYPSDILAGMALGHFFGMFINDAFMGIDKDVFQLAIETGRDRYHAGVTIRY